MFGWRLTLWAVIVLAALFFLYQVRAILPPFVAAVLIAVLLDPMIRRLQERGIQRARAVWAVFLVFFGVMTGVGILMAPVLTAQVGNLQEKLEDVSRRVTLEEQNKNYFLKWNPRYSASSNGFATQVDQFLTEHKATLERFGLPSTSQGVMTQYVEPHKREITQAIQSFSTGLLGIVGAFGSALLMMLFTPVFAILILLDMERLKGRSVALIPPSIRRETVQFGQDVANVFVRYLRGVTIVLIWYAVIAGTLLTILGAPYSFLLAVIFALIYLIPYVGAAMNALVLILLTTMSGRSENFLFGTSTPLSFALTITAIYFVAMFVFDQLVYARLVGNSVGLHPVVSFFVVFSGAALFGPIGMIFAFPVAGSVKVVLDRLLRITSSAADTLSLPAVPLRHRRAAI